MLYIAVALSLFALMGGMLLLDKTRKEGLGNFFKWISYLVIVVSLLMLACAGTRGIWRMACRTRMCPPSERCNMWGMDGRCGPGGNMMMHDGCMPGDGRCIEEMREYRMKGDADGHQDKMWMKHGCPMEDEEKEEKADTAKKK